MWIEETGQVVAALARGLDPAVDLAVEGLQRDGVAIQLVPPQRSGHPRGPDGRYLAYGRTENDRMLFAVCVRRPRGRVRVLTARDMIERERRFYRRTRRE